MTKVAVVFAEGFEEIEALSQWMSSAEQGLTVACLDLKVRL